MLLLLILMILLGGGICLLVYKAKQDQQKEEQLRLMAEQADFQAKEDTLQNVMDLIAEASSEESIEETVESNVSAREDESAAQETVPEETSLEEPESEIQESSEEESAKAQADEQAQEEFVPAEDVEKAVQQATAASSSPDDRVIDFATLQSKKNAHIYAWINVPGTNIDYPVLRHPTDNGYYLYHNLNGSSGYPGCIYTENWNSTDWTDPVTVLYGHDMRSTGTMFHQLHKFETQSFFDKNEYIYIYTPEKTLKYKIFATYVHSNEHLLANHNFSDSDSFNTFFNTVLSSAGGANHVRDGYSVSSGDKVITLSTCIKNKPNNRYLVFGVLE